MPLRFSMLAYLAIAACAGPAQTVDVTIVDFAFHAPLVEIDAGTTVRWTNMDFIHHTATSQTGPGTLVPSGLFDSGHLGFGEAFSFTFTQPGTVYYWCVPHGSSMQGEIRVRTACTGDVNGDRSVDLADLAQLLANYGAGGASREGGDLNGDGDVNLSDLSILLGAFGAVCG
jgi:plastocyanin